MISDFSSCFGVTKTDLYFSTYIHRRFSLLNLTVGRLVRKVWLSSYFYPETNGSYTQPEKSILRQYILRL